MVYIKHWSEFHNQAIDLYKRSPERTRYLIKSHPARQWLVLKVTDDFTTLKYRSRSTVILNRFESFNRELNAWMAGDGALATGGSGSSSEAATAAAQATSSNVASSAPAPAVVSSTSTPTPQSQSQNKKKKKGGGKK